MFSSVTNFFKRHKRKFIVAGAVVGGVYLAGRYALSRLTEERDKEAAERLIHAQMKHHFESNQRTCGTTVLVLLPVLKEQLIVLLDTDALTALLRKKTGDKIETWDKLKVLSFTRAVTSVYSVCFLTVLVRVQLNVMGRYLYLDMLDTLGGGHSEKNKRSSSSSSNRADGENKDGENLLSSYPRVSPAVQKAYLALVQYFLGPGLNQLIADVDRCVSSIVSDMSLKEQLTHGGLCGIIDHIKIALNQKLIYDGEILNYILPQSEAAESSFFASLNNVHGVGSSATAQEDFNYPGGGSSSNSSSSSSSNSNSSSSSSSHDNGSGMPRKSSNGKSAVSLKEDDGAGVEQATSDSTSANYSSSTYSSFASVQAYEYDPVLQLLVEETRQVISTEQFAHVMEAVLEVGFEQLGENTKMCFESQTSIVNGGAKEYPEGSSTALSLSSSSTVSTSSNVASSLGFDSQSEEANERRARIISLPLAKIIPIMAGQLHAILNEESNDVLIKSSNLDIVNQFSAVIYASLEGSTYSQDGPSNSIYNSSSVRSASAD